MDSSGANRFVLLYPPLIVPRWLCQLLLQSLEAALCWRLLHSVGVGAVSLAYELVLCLMRLSGRMKIGSH